MRDRPPDCHPLAFAAGIGAWQAAENVGNLKELCDFVYSVRHTSFFHARLPKREGNIVETASVGEQRDRLKEQTNVTRRGLELGHIPFVDDDPAFVGSKESGNRLQKSALPGVGRAKETQELSLTNR